jgi:hypothetical protein
MPRVPCLASSPLSSSLSARLSWCLGCDCEGDRIFRDCGCRKERSELVSSDKACFLHMSAKSAEDQVVFVGWFSVLE